MALPLLPQTLSTPTRRTMTDSHTNIQLTNGGQLRNFIALRGLPKPVLEQILDTAASFVDVGGREIKNVPLLRGKTVVNLFFEPSTRTRSTLELAAKRLSADVLNIDIARSATSKGESLMDMLRNLEAMASDMFVVRHADSGHRITSRATLPLTWPSSTPAMAAMHTPPKLCSIC